MMKVVSILALLIMGVAVLADPHHHQATQSVSDQIPDEVIFRLWLNNMTSNGKILRTDHILWSEADNRVLQAAMKSYQTAYQELVENHNGMADVAEDQTPFWNNLLALTHTTFAGLQASMSAEGFKRFDAFLQTLKSSPVTTVSPYDPGLGASAAALRKEASMMAGMSQTLGMTPNYSGIVTTVLTGGDLMDDFGTEADGTLPTSEWTATSGSFSMSSGTLSVSTNGSNGVAAMYFNGRGAVTNYQGQCSGTTVGTVPMGENGRYPAGAVRMSTDGGTFYTAFYDRGQIALWKFVNGTPSWVLPSGSYVYTAQTGDYIWICAEGSNITVKLMDAAGTMDGEIMSASDGDIATGYPGIWGQTTASGSTAGTATYWGGQTQGVMIETVGVSGDATCALGCPAGAYHYATVTNTDGTNGVNGYESGHVSPPTYIDFYWRQAYTWDELLGGVVPPNLTIGHDIICSELGNRQPCQ